MYLFLLFLSFRDAVSGIALGCIVKSDGIGLLILGNEMLPLCFLGQSGSLLAGSGHFLGTHAAQACQRIADGIGHLVEVVIVAHHYLYAVGQMTVGTLHLIGPQAGEVVRQGTWKATASSGV